MTGKTPIIHISGYCYVILLIVLLSFETQVNCFRKSYNPSNTLYRKSITRNNFENSGFGNNIVDRRFNNQPIRRDVMTAVWRDSVVSLTIPASKERTYALFSSLDEHPTWSPWLLNVDFDRETRLSKWSLRSLGLTISWDAMNTVMDAPNTVQWESLNGFPNKGRVQFSDDCDVKVAGYDEDGYEIYEEVDECSIIPESTLLTLTISYDLPQAGVILLETLGPKGQEFIQNTLLGDLKRFRERLVRDLREERMASFRASQLNRNSQKKEKNVLK